jgi:hypothetical protein
MRGAWIASLPLLSLPLLLSGCLSPAATVVSFAADGASYAATGKTITDHGASFVTAQDCASWHFFVGRAVCEDPKHPVPTAPLVQHGNGIVRASAEPAPTAAPKGSAPTVAPAGRYLMIGSFVDRGHAVGLAATYPDYHPQVVAVREAGIDFHRVVLGPLNEPQLVALRALGVAGMSVARPAADPPPPRALAAVSG